MSKRRSLIRLSVDDEATYGRLSIAKLKFFRLGTCSVCHTPDVPIGMSRANHKYYCRDCFVQYRNELRTAKRAAREQTHKPKSNRIIFSEQDIEVINGLLSRRAEKDEFLAAFPGVSEESLYRKIKKMFRKDLWWTPAWSCQRGRIKIIVDDSYVEPQDANRIASYRIDANEVWAWSAFEKHGFESLQKVRENLKHEHHSYGRGKSNRFFHQRNEHEHDRHDHLDTE